MKNDIKQRIKEAEENYPEGIYFGMPANDYFDLPYFSRSSSMNVLFDLEETKHQMVTPFQPTKAMDLGTAIHSMFLEPEDYKNTYARVPLAEDYPGKVILKTVDDFKEILKGVGEKTSGNKADLIERSIPHIDSEKTVIWDEEMTSFYQMIKTDNKLILDKGDFETMQGIIESYKMQSEIPRLMENGYSEVTIIWKDEETSMMCKCRLDRVRPEAIVDIKSFSVKDRNKSLFEYLFRQTTSNYYNYQYVIYAEALETIINKINSGKAKVYGEVDEGWIKDFLKTPFKQFFIIYIRTAAPYQMKAVELQKSQGEGGTNNSYFSVAHQNWRFAINKFARAVNTGIWREKEVEVLDDSYVPNVIYQSPIY
jgi:hypothetical protein